MEPVGVVSGDVTVWIWISGSLFTVLMAVFAYLLGARGKTSRQESASCRAEVDRKIEALIGAQASMTAAIGKLTGSFETYLQMIKGMHADG